jgi:hypothetical protein
MYLFSLITILLVFFILLITKNTINEHFNNEKRIACFPKRKHTEIKSFSSEYPDKYGIFNDIPDITESLVAKNEQNFHENHITYKDSPMSNKINGNPLPKNYCIIDKDFHTPREGNEIIPSPPVYNLVRVDDTNHFLVDTPNSIWRRVVPRD